MPQLRFAEFSGEWQEEIFGEIGDFYNGLTGKSGDDFGSGKPYITYKSIFDNSKIDLRRVGYVQICETEKQNQVAYGDVFFTTSSETPNEVGTSSVLLDYIDECYLNSFCFGYRFKNINIHNPSFFRYVFRSFPFRKEMVKLAQGSTRYNISKTEAKKIKLLLPKTAEQHKIGSFLSAVDSKIEGLEQELGLLKRYKQGIMQRLFNQILRFKDNHGNPFPDWQYVSIKEIGEVITGSTPSKTNDGFWEGSFPWATAQDFKSKYISTTIQTLSEQGKKKSRIIPKNSVLITCIASIGLNAINKVECATNQQINAIVCNEKHDSEFIYYAIGFNNRSLKNLAGQTAVPIVTKTAFESFRLFVAKDKVEQKKIADFLSAIDEKIEAKQNQITTARNWKKSLLQKMFV